MPFLERQFCTQMTVKGIEEKIGKPLLIGSALGGDKFHDICDTGDNSARNSCSDK